MTSGTDRDFASSTSSPNIYKQASTARVLDLGFWGLTLCLAVGSGAVLLWIIVQTAITASPAMQTFGLGFLFSTTWDPVNNVYGVLPQIYGTLVTTLIALLVAIPVGIGTAVFLTEDFVPKYIRSPIAFAIEVIVAIPSVVLGIWGIFVLVPALRPFFRFLNNFLGWIPFFGGDAPRGNNVLLVGLVLALMVTPVVASLTRSTFEVLPAEIRQGSLALGATRWETIIRVMIPAGLSGIIGSVMLAMGRAMGETMVAAMLIGNANRINVSILQPGATITGLIASKFGEAGRAQVAALMYAGVVLMILSLLVNVFAELIIHRYQRKY